jgi:predicted metal-dependent peptidase
MSDPFRAWLREFVNRPAFLNKYPHYAFVLARMDPIDDRSIRVMAVSAHGSRFYLHVNVPLFTKHPEWLAGVLLHEVHHAVLGHLSHPKFQGSAHPDLMDLAMEISANEYIREPLPGTPVTCGDYSRFGLRIGQSTMERYDLLVKARLAGHHVPGAAPLDEHHPFGVGSVYPSAPAPDPGLVARVHRIIEESTAEAARLGRDLRGPAGLLAGRLPGQLIEQLAGIEEKPEDPMDWKAAIQMFVGLVRTPIHTYARPNRRFPDKVGVIPGRIFFPGECDTPSLVVAIDTSGSMSREELSEVARQLVLLSDLVRITIVECDAKIHRTYRFEGKLPSVMGRGGTDLRPVFAPDFLNEHHPDGIIYFTDGFGPYPLEDPGVKTLWVLTKAYDFPCPWGQKAKMGEPSEG